MKLQFDSELACHEYLFLHDLRLAGEAIEDPRGVQVGWLEVHRGGHVLHLQEPAVEDRLVAEAVQRLSRLTRRPWTA